MQSIQTNDNDVIVKTRLVSSLSGYDSSPNLLIGSFGILVKVLIGNVRNDVKLAQQENNASAILLVHKRKLSYSPALLEWMQVDMHRLLK